MILRKAEMLCPGDMLLLANSNAGGIGVRSRLIAIRCDDVHVYITCQSPFDNERQLFRTDLVEIV